MMTLEEALAKADEWRIKYIDAANNAVWWRNEAGSIENQRKIVFRALSDLTNKNDELLTSRNGWRLIALVQVAAFVVILVNHYLFGVVA